MAKLTVLNGSLQGRVFELVPGGSQIGRVNSTVVLAESSVSSRHAKLWCEAGQWLVMDLGSTNGTLLNGAICERNTPNPLTDGDKLSFGAVIVGLQLEASATVEVAPIEALGPGRRVPDAVLAAVAAAAAPPPAPAPPARDFESEIAGLQTEVRVRDGAIAELQGQLAAFATAAELRASELARELAARADPEVVATERASLEASHRAALEQAGSEAAARQQALEARLAKAAAELDAANRTLSEKDAQLDAAVTHEMARTHAEQKLAIADAEREQLVGRLTEVFASQKALDAALKERTAAWEEATRRLEAVEGSAPPAAALEAERSRADALATRLAASEQELEAARAAAKRDVDALADDLEAAKAESDALRARLAAADEALATAREAAGRDSSALAEAAEAARAEASELKARLAAADEALATAREAAGRDSSALAQAAEAARAEASELKAKLAAADEALATAREAAGRDSSALAQARAEAEQFRAKLGALEASLANAGGAQEEIARAMAEARERASAEHARAEALAAQAAEARELASRLEAQLAESRASSEVEQDRTRSMLSELQGIRDHLAVSESQIEALRSAASAGVSEAQAGLAAALEAAEAARARAAGLEAERDDARAAEANAASALAAAQEALQSARSSGTEAQDELGAQAAAERARADALASRLESVEAALRDAETAAAEAVSLRERLVSAESAAASAGEDGARVAELEAAIAARASELEEARGETEAMRERLAQLRDERAELVAERDDALARADAAPTAGPESHDLYLRSQAVLQRQLTLSIVDAVNGAVSQLRRNSEILKGYIADTGRLADAVRALDPAILPAESQDDWRALLDETQPELIVQNMQGIADENSEAANRAKALLLDFKDALASEDADVERCLAKGQRLAALIADAVELEVEIGPMLPPLGCDSPEAVIFGWSLLEQARALASAGGPATIRLGGGEGAIELLVGPLAADAGARLAAPSAASARVVSEFARALGGTLEVRDGDGSQALIFRLPPRAVEA